MLPLPVLEKARDQLVCYEDSGMSVMEMSHRSPVYDKIIKSAESNLRTLLNVPENYRILFMQGGASGQFAAVPLNLMTGSGKADYIVSGQFSGKAFKEAKKYGDVVCAASSEAENFARVPTVSAVDFRPDADYVHMCFNNTIYGTKFPYIPDTAGIPLVADMSSCILSEPVDVTRFGVIYAGAQKNMAPAGVTVSDRQRKSPYPRRFLLQKHGGKRFDVQHAPLLFDLYVRACGGVPPLDRRASRDGKDQ